MFSGSVHAQEWGTLTGRIVVAGDVTIAEKLSITRDEEFCGQHGLVDESLMVNEKNRGLKNVVVWLSSRADVPVHRSYSSAPTPATLDNRDCRFVPRIVSLRTGQTLQSRNSDPVAHNIAVYARRNTPFSIVIPENRPLEKTFSREELMPIRVDCSIHAWMQAYLMITEHPYSAVTDQNGEFTIRDLPYGKWNFRFWHERPGYISTFITSDGDVPLKRGTMEYEINSGKRDLGKLSVSALEFEISD